LLLFVSMVVLVTPVTISSQLKIIIPAIEQHLEAAARWLDYNSAVRVMSSNSAYFAYNQLPAMLLVVINSLLLPQCIYSISVTARPHRHSSVEVIQLHLNFAFLVLNSMVIPFLGLKSIDGLIAFGKREHHHPQLLLTEIVEAVSRRLMHSPGVFALRYILNCACMTNVNSLLQIPQLLYRAYARCMAVTARETFEAEEVWVFAWGYWYAWTISIFTMGIVISSAVPSTLPCAALFFAVKHAVDRHNLLHRVYSHGPDIESENLLAIRVLHYMRCVIAVWWWLMGCGFLFTAVQMPEDLGCSVVPHWSVRVAAGLLMSLAMALVIFSWWTHQSILHDNQFHNVDMTERGLSGTGEIFRGLFSNIEGILKCACCSPAAAAYGPLGASDLALDRFDSQFSDAGSPGNDLPGVAMFPECDGFKAGSAVSWDAKSIVLQSVAACGPL